MLHSNACQWIDDERYDKVKKLLEQRTGRNISSRATTWLARRAELKADSMPAGPIADDLAGLAARGDQ